RLDYVRVRLTHALRVPAKNGGNGATESLPAAEYVDLALKSLTSENHPMGGDLIETLIPYLTAKDSTLYTRQSNGDSEKARAALPPPLVREGEKVQPDWLFRFLREPTMIRPQLADGGPMLLRMPRFNMSDDDARTLVNYFAAVDRRHNPGIGLEYP